MREGGDWGSVAPRSGSSLAIFTGLRPLGASPSSSCHCPVIYPNTKTQSGLGKTGAVPPGLLRLQDRNADSQPFWPRPPLLSPAHIVLPAHPGHLGLSRRSAEGNCDGLLQAVPTLTVSSPQAHEGSQGLLVNRS